jgi:hypothetical protein
MIRDQALKILEQRLETELGAVGKTYLEKVKSLEKRLPAPFWKQLQDLPSVPDSEFTEKLSSSHKQVGLFGFTPNKPETESLWTEAQRTEARAKISEGMVGAKTKRLSFNARLAWWFYDQKRAIPARVARLSHWRWLVGLGLGLVGAFLGWSLAGLGLAGVSFAVWGVLGVWIFGEQMLARVLWLWVRLLEWVWRVLPWLILVVLAGGLWWLLR